jgi:hypothetical protein
MADNPNVNGIQVAADDRSGVFVQRTVPGGATGVTVNSVSVTTGGGTLVGANPSRQALLLVNTSSVALEISPTSGFAFGAGFPLPAGATFSTAYQGVMYARSGSSTASVRYWDEYDT